MGIEIIRLIESAKRIVFAILCTHARMKISYNFCHFSSLAHAERMNSASGHGPLQHNWCWRAGRSAVFRFNRHRRALTESERFEWASNFFFLFDILKAICDFCFYLYKQSLFMLGDTRNRNLEMRLGMICAAERKHVRFFNCRNFI